VLKNFSQGIIHLFDFHSFIRPAPFLFLSSPAVPQIWSVGVEEFFYMSTVLLAITHRRNESRMIRSLTLISAVAALWCFLASHHDYQLFLTLWYRNPVSQLLIFVLGCAAQRSNVRFSNPRIHQTRLLLGLAVPVVCLWGTKYGPQPFDDVGNFILYQPVVVVLTACFVMLDRDVPESRISRTFGSYSYPVYVSHFLVIDLLSPELSDIALKWSSSDRMLCVLFLSTMLGVGVYYLVEKPTSRLRDWVRGVKI
jgi:peptidoglycan/LPS O-acetylase OafA/YrhL